MAGERKLTVVIAGDAKGLDSALGSATKSVGGLDTRVGGFSTTAKLGLAAVSVGAVAMGKSFVDAAVESQKVTRQTEATLKSMGTGAGLTADQVAGLSTKLSLQTGVDDELIQSGENLLLTFGKVRNEVGKGNDVFTRATGLAVDMSVAMGTDLAGANIQLGKALNDPIKGITALTRVGVSFTEQQKEQIKTLVQSGDTLGAQKIILSELDKQFGGSAAAQATAGEKLKVVWGNMQEQLGGQLLPIVEGVAGGATHLLSAFQALPGPVQSVVTTGVALGAGLLAAGSALSFVVGHARTAREAFSSLLNPLTGTEAGLGRVKTAAVTLGAVGVVAGLAAWANSFNHTTVDIDAMSAALARNDAAAQRQIGSFLVVLDHWGKLDGVIRQAADANVIGADRMVAAAGAAGLSSDKIAHLKEIVDSKRGADTQGAVDQKKYADETQNAAAQAGGLSTQLEEVANQLRAQFDPLFAAQSAVQGLATAQTAAAAATREHGAGSREAAAANQTAVQAALTYQGALISLEVAVKKGDVSLEDATGTLRAWASQGIITKGQADQVSASFVNVKGKADAIPKSVMVTVDANVDPATGKFNTFVRGVNGFGGALGKGSSGGIAGKRAGGGPVSLARTYLVGEEGPELFVPGASGTIIPNRATAPSLFAGGFGGTNILIQIDARGSAGDISEHLLEKIQDGMERIAVRGGTVRVG